MRGCTLSASLSAHSEGDAEDGYRNHASPRQRHGEFAGKEFLLNLDRAERAEFYKLLDEAPWEGPTASGHWQVRDLCGHLIDVTEGYLERFAHGAGGQEAPAPLGLPIMAAKLDEGATRFRSLSKEQAIARLKTASDKIFEIFDALDEQQWSGEIVPHTYHGPVARRASSPRSS